MRRIRLALVTAALALAGTAIGVGTAAAPANAGVLSCVGSAITLEHDLRVDSGHAIGSDLAHITYLVGQLAFDVVTLDVTDIQAQAEYVVIHAADGVIHVAQQTVNDAAATLAACRVH